MEIGICKNCGKCFEYVRKAKHRIFCCKQCYYDYGAEKRKECSKKTYNQLKEHKKKAISSRKEIAKINRQAQKAGLSYGKFLAQKNAPHFDRESRRWV